MKERIIRCNLKHLGKAPFQSPEPEQYVESEMTLQDKLTVICCQSCEGLEPSEQCEWLANNERCEIPGQMVSKILALVRERVVELKHNNPYTKPPPEVPHYHNDEYTWLGYNKACDDFLEVLDEK